jgi:hypothetical protein
MIRLAASTALLGMTASVVACSKPDPKAEARELEVAMTASEALALAFADSVRENTAEARARSEARRIEQISNDTLSACADPVPVEATTRYANSMVTVHLPTDFKLVNEKDIERQIKNSGYARFEFVGADGSKVSVYGENSGSVHSGWTGLVTSECNLDIAGRSAHLDIANASVGRPDRVVHAIISASPYLSLVFLAHARSIERQKELLHAAHTVNVGPLWGQK